MTRTTDGCLTQSSRHHKPHGMVPIRYSSSSITASEHALPLSGRAGCARHMTSSSPASSPSRPATQPAQIEITSSGRPPACAATFLPETRDLVSLLNTKTIAGHHGNSPWWHRPRRDPRRYRQRCTNVDRSRPYSAAACCACSCAKRVLTPRAVLPPRPCTLRSPSKYRLKILYRLNAGKPKPVAARYRSGSSVPGLAPSIHQSSQPGHARPGQPASCSRTCSIRYRVRHVASSGCTRSPSSSSGKRNAD